MDFPAGQKKVAVVERWPLVEVRQYTLQSKKNFRAKGLGHFELTIIETLIKTRRQHPQQNDLMLQGSTRKNGQFKLIITIR